MTTHNTNEACCSIPPVHAEYTPKGTSKALGDFKKVYVTGPEKGEKAIVAVYDIFGYFPQTQQGADIIASTLKATVFMPDFFEPNGPFPIEDFPPSTDEEKQKLQNFFGGVAAPPANAEKLNAFGKVLKADGFKQIGVYGMCWGGKVTMLVGSDSSIFNAVSLLHPAMLSADDAKKLQVPLGLYPSKDEPKDEFEKIVKIVSEKPFASKSDSKYYGTMHHGWAAARGDLKNEENKKEYEDVYTRLADFFHKALA